MEWCQRQIASQIHRIPARIPHHKNALSTVASSRDGSGICPSVKIAGSRTPLPDPEEAPASVTMRVVPTFFLYSTAYRYARLPFVNLSAAASHPNITRVYPCECPSIPHESAGNGSSNRSPCERIADSNAGNLLPIVQIFGVQHRRTGPRRRHTIRGHAVRSYSRAAAALVR